MTQPVPKWIMINYSKLWESFGSEEFDHEDSSEIIDNKKMVSIILSKLRKAGWLEAKLDPQDYRKRIYQLKKPREVIEKMESKVEE